VELSPESKLSPEQRLLPGVRRFMETWLETPDGDFALGEAADRTPLGWELFSAVLADWLSAQSQSMLAAPWRERTLLSLVRHLLFRHHAYLRHLMARVEGCWEREGRALLDDGENLRRKFKSLQAELEAHLLREENTLFPVVLEAEETGRGLREGARHKSLVHPLRILRWEHNARGDELSEMRSMVNEWSRRKTGGEEWRDVSAGIREMEVDLSLHAYLEDAVLFKRLEDETA